MANPPRSSSSWSPPSSWKDQPRLRTTRPLLLLLFLPLPLPLLLPVFFSLASSFPPTSSSLLPPGNNDLLLPPPAAHIIMMATFPPPPAPTSSMAPSRARLASSIVFRFIEPSNDENGPLSVGMGRRPFFVYPRPTHSRSFSYMYMVRCSSRRRWGLLVVSSPLGIIIVEAGPVASCIYECTGVFFAWASGFVWGQKLSPTLSSRYNR